MSFYIPRPVNVFRIIHDMLIKTDEWRNLPLKNTWRIIFIDIIKNRPIKVYRIKNPYFIQLSEGWFIVHSYVFDSPLRYEFLRVNEPSKEFIHSTFKNSVISSLLYRSYILHSKQNWTLEISFNIIIISYLVTW